MKTRSLIICAAALIAAAACSKEFAQSEKISASELKISGTMEFDPQTRMTLAEANSKVNVGWEVGDSIYVFNKVAEYTKASNNTPTVTNYNRVKCVVSAVDASGKATFTPGAGEDLSVLDPANKTYYACTVGETASSARDFLFADNVINFVCPSTTTGYEPGKLNKKVFYAVARTTITDNGELNFNFKPITSLAKFTIPEGLDIYRVRLYSYWQSSKDKYLTYYGQLSFDDAGNWSVTRTNGYKQGGAANAAFWFNAEHTPAAPGVYYFPFSADPANKLRGASIGYDASNWTNITFANPVTEESCLTYEPGKVYDFGTIPAL